MAVLSNGLETIEKGSTVWRLIINNNMLKLYTKDEVYSKTEIDANFYDKTEIDANFYDSTEVDNKFATKASLAHTWAPLSLQNGWSAYGSGYDQPASSKNEYGMVSIKGAIKDGTLGDVVATLPADQKPAYIRRFAVSDGSNSVATVEINSNGDITVVDGDTSLVSLEITYII